VKLSNFCFCVKRLLSGVSEGYSLVNYLSMFEMSLRLSILGTNGGFIFLLARDSQSISEKNLWFLISFIP